MSTMTVWFKTGELRQIPGKVLNENIWDMGLLEIESLENEVHYLVERKEITNIIEYL